jgi:hypothetical protein
VSPFTGMKHSTLLAFALLALLTGKGWQLGASPAAPDWLKTVIARPATMDYGSAHAAVLWNETIIDVSRGGTFTTRSRKVIRLLPSYKTEYTVARQLYDKSSDEVRSFLAWLILPSGEVIAYRAKDTVDIAVRENIHELYTEAREKLISAEYDAKAGAVFAYESVVEEHSIFSQIQRVVQEDIPSEYSAITINLPEGWHAIAQIFNHEPVAPLVKKRSLTWEFRNLPAIEDEPMAPAMSATAAWLAFDIVPPANSNTGRQTFNSWSSVALYLTPKYEAAAVPDAAIKAKAQTFAAGTSILWERINQLCQQAQKVNYVSIALNTAHAGGCFPNPAASILQHNYGDCKDKATLLKSLLAAQGVDSFPLLVFSGESPDVRAEWVSPQQFNHCIIAIKVDDSVDLPAVKVHPQLGRLLLFDPTDPFVPPGWLPKQDGGGQGLLLAASAGGLIAIPQLRADESRTTRTVHGRLYANGALSAQFDEELHGQSAAEMRAKRTSNTLVDYHKFIEYWLKQSVPLAELRRLESKDDFAKAEFSLTAEFESPTHGKLMQNTLLVFKPVFLQRPESIQLKKDKRTQPLVINPLSLYETYTLDLPAEFRIEELPASVELKTPFGYYKSAIQVESDSRIVVERSLEQSPVVLPASEYEGARSFYERISQSEQSPVVLKHL